jgi:mycothione reductase
VKTYDLIVLGAGSGNSIPGGELAHLRTAVVDPSRFGGTCLNRGCIPSKMFVVTADVARSAREAARLGVNAHLDGVDWKAVRDRVFGRIDPLHLAAVTYRQENGVDVYSGAARFVSPKVLEVDGELLTADQIVVAVGARPIVPDLPGLDRVPFQTSDTIMRIDEVPESMLVVGGGFIAAEMGHVLEAFGARVTIVQRGPRLLMAEDEAISTRFTELATDRFELFLNSDVVAVEPRDGGVRATVRGPGGDTHVGAAMLLLAAGRQPNTDLVDAAAGGLQLDDHGHVRTDRYYRTSVPGVWSFGDAANHFQLKHMANAERRVLSHNLAHPDDLQPLTHTLVPHAVFSDPQVASVGLTEQAARAAGTPYVTVTRPYSETAYGWALEDTTSFVKLIVDPDTRLLLGTHIIGPSAAILIQPLLQAMTLGQTVDTLARDVLYIHPALTEVLEQALLEV